MERRLRRGTGTVEDLRHGAHSLVARVSSVMYEASGNSAERDDAKRLPFPKLRCDPRR